MISQMLSNYYLKQKEQNALNVCLFFNSFYHSVKYYHFSARDVSYASQSRVIQRHCAFSSVTHSMFNLVSLSVSQIRRLSKTMVVSTKIFSLILVGNILKKTTEKCFSRAFVVFVPTELVYVFMRMNLVKRKFSSINFLKKAQKILSLDRLSKNPEESFHWKPRSQIRV